MAFDQDHFWPHRYSSTYKLLDALLQGRKMTVIDTLMEFNLMTPNARVSELRRVGWPIQSLKVPHPKLPNEEMVAYHIDAHFRHWWITAQAARTLEMPSTLRPIDYKPQSGRGKFAEERTNL